MGQPLKTEHPEYWNRIFTDDTSRNVRRALAAYRISEWGPIVHAYRVTRNDLPGREDVIKQGERLKLKSGSWRIQVPRIRLIPRKGTVTPQAAEMSYLKTGKRQNSSPTDDLHYVVVEEKIPFVARHGLEHDMGIDEHGLEQVVTAAKLANTADLHRGNVSVQGPGERAKISMVDIEPMSKFKETVEAGVLERDVKRVRDLDYWQGVSVQEVYQGLNKKGHYGLHPYLSKKSGESKYEYKERLRSRAIDVLTITRISWKTAQKTNNYAVISAIKAEAKKRLSPGHASLVIKWLNSKYGRNIEALLEYEEILTAVGGLQPLVIPEANS